MPDKKIAQLTQIDTIASGDWFIIGDTSASDNAKKASPAQAKAGIGLSSVTDDAQLKRSANDLNSFTSKASPVGADIILIEDSAASFAKKKVTVSSLPVGAVSVWQTTSTPSLSPTSTYNHYYLTAQNGNISIGFPSGFTACGRVTFLICTTSAVTITWNSGYKNFLDTIPTSITSGQTVFAEFIYDSAHGKWLCTRAGQVAV